MQTYFICVSVNKCKLFFTYFYFNILRRNALELSKFSLTALYNHQVFGGKMTLQNTVNFILLIINLGVLAIFLNGGHTSVTACRFERCRERLTDTNNLS